MPARQILELAAVSKVYGDGTTTVAALREVDLMVHAGEFVAVMGPSGSGKSSLLALAGGLDSATEGEVYVRGTPLGRISLAEKARLRRRAVGYVFQDYNLIPTLTAAENVSLPLELDGAKPAKAQRQAKDALRQVGIEDLAGRFLDELSGGQQQRVAIARAIVGEKALILADEPTGALDSVTGEEIMAVLRRRADAGAGVVLVTHEARHAGWADRVVFLRDGRVVDQARAETDPHILLTDAGGPAR
ncbi:ABC transporter ATP-binding protein [Citricoccus sp. I39-566]|uniref:ABC transporter ATP-binding protein n=1 Tax=Citricoccus sp. I39-566 TaxID=3073268 RepID=UPI00286B1CAD|nr:ABC transporter ATP-binding protein [Citricoccus sp. I39-566]WMY79925.1 ABC transporter ATP-binding protein [Citricoccus sp. I39-566]